MDSNMDSNYVFLCGVMWCRFGQQDAGKELLRAADSGDPDMKVLAGAMFANGMRRLRESEKRAQPVPAQYLGENPFGGEPCGSDHALCVGDFCASSGCAIPCVVDADGFDRAIGV